MRKRIKLNNKITTIICITQDKKHCRILRGPLPWPLSIPTNWIFTLSALLQHWNRSRSTWLLRPTDVFASGQRQPRILHWGNVRQSPKIWCGRSTWPYSIICSKIQGGRTVLYIRGSRPVLSCGNDRWAFWARTVGRSLNSGRIQSLIDSSIFHTKEQAVKRVQ